jgi:NADPH-dependent curcumin reductase CurA
MPWQELAAALIARGFMSDVVAAGREVKLAVKTEGLPGAGDFALVSAPLPVPRPGEVLVRNRYFVVSASLRAMIAKGAEDVKGVPFPALREGDTLFGEALGEVVAAPVAGGLARGDLVVHHRGWRDYAAVTPQQCRKVDATQLDPVAHLGHGWTAYAALTRGATIKRGDTVFVSSGAGAIGSMAGQIARVLGAARVIGSTSSAAKAARLVSELGYDAAIFRGGGPIADQLAEVAPDGLDVFLDSVGGEQLSAGIAAAREGARIVIVGALAGQLAARGAGRTAPFELDSFQLLLKRIALRGYSADDDPDAYHEWTARFRDWLHSGALRFPHEIVVGLEHAPSALARAIRGDYFGAVIVEL